MKGEGRLECQQASIIEFTRPDSTVWGTSGAKVTEWEAFSVCDPKVVEKDSFMEISFHIPNDNTQLGAVGKEAVATFEGIATLTPSNRNVAIVV
ncbi:hypothetical protein L1887_38830 [Cichorium endivia]|nr:hypothetical protein L1887_38830 [Cichorium endivia]